MLELALTAPFLLIVATGIVSFGIFLNQYIQVTDATNIGAKLLAVKRGNTLDPCSLVSAAVIQATPALNPNLFTFSLTLTGGTIAAPQATTYTGTSCSSSSNTTGAAANLVQGNPVQVTVTYPCSITAYGASLVPGCTITSQLTEIEQ
jgi:Flp pilus assembly protein TadG